LILGGLAAAEQATPISKVVDLLSGMLVKSKEEKHAEQVMFGKYTQWCEDTAVEKKRSIEVAEREIGGLEAEIDKQESISRQMTDAVKELDESISMAETDIREATEVRAKEKADFEDTDKEYAESIDAVERAVYLLKKQGTSKGDAESLLQQTMGAVQMLPEASWAKLFDSLSPKKVALLQQEPTPEAYETHMDGIIDMLKELKTKLTGEKEQSIKEEMNKQHAFEMMVQDLSDQVEYDKQDRNKKNVAQANAKQAMGVAKSDLSSTVEGKKEDEHSLSDLEAQCHKKSDEFKARQDLRAGEVEAIEKAIEILSSGAVKGNADKHLPGLVQKKKAASLLQLRSRKTTPDQKELFHFLQDKAQRLSSPFLALAAAQVASTSAIGEDPMKKVKGMIEDLIEKLEEEARQEGQHHDWCQQQLKDNKMTRDAKGAEVEKLQAEIEEGHASVQKLAAAISQLGVEVQELNKAMAKASEDRQEEKAKNKATIKDAKEASAAVAQALEVLRSFYDKAGQATALTQTKHHQEPETWSAPYKGQQAENGGVLGMLEVVASDFARLESETEQGEADAEAAYEKFMQETGGCGYVGGAEVCGLKHEKEQQSKKHDRQMKKTEAMLQRAETDLDDVQGELDKATEYYDTLKPQCVQAKVSPEERIAQRQAEIDSLQEALQILTGEE